MNVTKKPLYDIYNLKKATFHMRLNRFVSEIKYEGKIELAHIHDPGRLKELLVKDAEVLFSDSKGKLKYYVKAVKAGNEWVLIDSAQHSKIAIYVFKFLLEFSHVREIKKEVRMGNSRIDFLLDEIPLEVKGCTLVKEGIALFPDAPTERGTRHIEEIIKFKGIVVFLVFRKAKMFAPNWETDPKFSQKLSEAKAKNIPIVPLQISFDGKTLYLHDKIPLSDF